MLTFLGIGAQKAGTTWIAENLARHPGITFPGGKEVHFWDWHYQRGLPWYQALFTDAATTQGDISPSYAFLPPERIVEIHHHYPDLRLLYSVRNPIDRAWSAARMMLKRCEMTLDEASDAWFTDVFHSQGSLQRGNCVEAVDRWLAVFPREQLLLTRFEDISEHPLDLLRAIAGHIGADPAFFTEETVETGRIHTSIDAPIRPSLLPILQELYDVQIRAMRSHPVLQELYNG